MLSPFSVTSFNILTRIILNPLCESFMYLELQNLSWEICVDPTPISQRLKDEVVYKCRKCRRSLFRSSSILDYNEGSGPIAFARKRMAPSLMSITGCQAQHKPNFIDLVQWMEFALLGVMDGQLFCTKCNAKLGPFVWYGKQCSRSRRTTPAFQIHKNREAEKNMLLAWRSQTRKTWIHDFGKKLADGMCYFASCHS